MAKNHEQKFAKHQQLSLEPLSRQMGERSPFNLEPSLISSGMGNPQPYSMDISIKPNSIRCDLETPQSAKGQRKSVELNFKGFGSQELASPMKLFRGVENLVSRLGFGGRNGTDLPNQNSNSVTYSNENQLGKQTANFPQDIGGKTAGDRSNNTRSNKQFRQKGLPLTRQDPMVDKTSNQISSNDSASGAIMTGLSQGKSSQASNSQPSVTQGSLQDWLGTKIGDSAINKTGPNSVSNTIPNGVSGQRLPATDQQSQTKSPIVG
ncbi:MAG TPA: hypothetical protein V6C65_24685, partial [Allocoleopsis sp.]